MTYFQMSAEERRAEYACLQKEFDELKAKGLNLNMARGKPGKAQLDMVSDVIFNLMDEPGDFVSNGIDVRNYGEMSGIPAAKQLFAEILDCRPEQVFVGGNSSLQLMYDTISKAYTHGLLHSERPWCKEEKVKWLCPVPGYDRHFKITESFGFEMVNIPMTGEGPDMDAVEEAVKDPTVKGIWCVPKYSNPDGIIYSDETVRRMAALKPAAPDFTVMWDNAYCVHEFEGEYVPFPNILDIAREAGSEDRFFEFASTSKITFPGYGVSCMVCSVANMTYLKNLLGAEIISYMQWLINVKEDGSNPVRNRYFLPVTSGMEYTVKDNGNGQYTLLGVTVNGSPIEAETVYKVMILSDDSFITDPMYCNCPIPQELAEKRVALSGKNIDILTRCLNVTEQLLAPEQYITIAEEA